jgi:oligoribonuclease NrnB/cAMP/cGMP phosphodiesterase (DHH superfamily)
MRNICVTHKYCYDGLASAWVFEENFKLDRGRTTSDDVIFTTRDNEWEERHLLDLIENKFDIGTIYFIDYCPTNNALKSLVSNQIDFKILDHHADAYLRVKALGYEDKIIYDSEHSGCVLAWQYFFGNTRPIMPRVFEYIEKQDLWKMNQQDEFQAEWLQYKIHDYETSEISHILLVYDHSDAHQIGSTLWFKKKNEIDFITRKPALIDFDGKEVLAVNSNTNRSEIGHVLSEKSPTGLGLVYSVSPYNSVHVSVRGKGANGFCKTYAGGGHEEASGFSMELKKFMSYLETAKPYKEGVKK